MNMEELRLDFAVKQKKGIHFIIASVIIWLLILSVQLTDLPVLTKNLFVFCCTAPLMPIAFGFSKLLKIQFSDKTNPLNKAGLIFSLNQMLYILIAMWVYYAVPDKMVMVIAMIFGAHLLPFSWLYKSKSYAVLSIIIPVMALIIGCNFSAVILSVIMLITEIIFTTLLILETKLISENKTSRQL